MICLFRLDTRVKSRFSCYKMPLTKRKQRDSELMTLASTLAGSEHAHASVDMARAGILTNRSQEIGFQKSLHVAQWQDGYLHLCCKLTFALFGPLKWHSKGLLNDVGIGYNFEKQIGSHKNIQIQHHRPCGYDSEQSTTRKSAKPHYIYSCQPSSGIGEYFG